MEPLVKNPTMIDYCRLNGMFTGNNSNFSDIDGVLERAGHFIFLDCKHAADQGMKPGVMRMWRALSKAMPSARIISVELTGERLPSGALDFNPTRWQSIHDKPFHFTHWRNTNLEEFKSSLQQWERLAKVGKL